MKFLRTLFIITAGFLIGIYFAVPYYGEAQLRILQVSQGGTGASSFTSGECLVGNGTGAITTQACGGGGAGGWNDDGTLVRLSAITDSVTIGSSLGFGSGSATTTLSWAASRLGIGTTTPGALWSVAGDVLTNGTTTSLLGFRGPYYIATSTATSTFAGGLILGTGGLNTNGLTLGGTIRQTTTGTSTFTGGITAVNLQSTGGLTLANSIRQTGTATSTFTGGLTVGTGGLQANALTLSGDILSTGKINLSSTATSTWSGGLSVATGGLSTNGLTISANIRQTGTGTSTFTGGLHAASLVAINGIQTNVTSCDSLDTNSQGVIICGTDATGGGGGGAGGWDDNGVRVNLSTTNDLVEIGTNASTTIGAQFSVTATTAPAILFGLKGVANQRGDFFRILDSSDNQLLTFSAGGNLGIGTSTPAYGLAVASSTLITGTTTSMAGFRGPIFDATSTGSTFGVLSFNGRPILTSNINRSIIMGDITGDARGTDCIDIQTARTITDKVCAGTENIAIGIQNKVVSGWTWGSAVGISNTLAGTGEESFIFGFGNTITSGSQSSAVGFQNNIGSGADSSAAFGYKNAIDANSLRSVAFGASTTVDASEAGAFGIAVSNNVANSVVFGITEDSKLRILNTQRMGFGTTTPGTTLSISGDGVITGDLRVRSIYATSTTATSTFLAGVQANTFRVVTGPSLLTGGLRTTGTMRFEGLISCDTIDTNADGVLSCGTDETGGGGAGGWDDNGVRVNLTTINDLVEIGTNASTTIGAQLSITSTTTGAILFGLKGVSAQRGDFLRILDNNNNQLLTFSAGGNLGIGTSTPAYGLAVASSTLITGTTTSMAGFRGPIFDATSTGSTFGVISFNGRPMITANSNRSIIIGDITGNARGTDCIDISTVRGLATDVCAGTESVILGSVNSMNSGATGVTIVGDSNTYSGTAGEESSLFGFGNTIVGASQATAVGYSNNISAETADNSGAFGLTNTVSAIEAFAFGANMTNSTANSVMLGISNTAALRILNTNLMGFATATPGTALSITGDSSITGSVRALYFYATSTTATSTFLGGVQANTFRVVTGPSLITGGLRTTGTMRFEGLVSCDTIDTNADGVLSCGTDASGGGGGGAGGWDDNGVRINLTTTNDLVEIGASASTTIGAALSVTSTTTGAILFGLKGVVSQRGDLFRVLDSSDTILTVINAAGGLGIGTSTPGMGFGVATSSLFTSTSTLLSGIITPHIVATGTLNLYTAITSRLTIDASGRIGFSSTTPWGTFSLEALEGTVDFRTPIFVVGDQGTSSPILFIGADGNVKVGTSTASSTYVIRDKLFVDGSINSSFHHFICYGPLLRTKSVSAVSLDCGDSLEFSEDTNGSVDGRGLVWGDVYPAFLSLTAGEGGGNAGDGAAIAVDQDFFSIQNTPIFETTLRAQSGLTNAIYIAGIVTKPNAQPSTLVANYIQGTPTREAFDGGAYFTASTTGNWFAITTTGSATTSINTGVAPTTASSSMQRLRIELTTSAAIFSIENNIVANISTTLPNSSTLMSPFVGIGLSGGTAGLQLHMNKMEFWFLKE